MQVFDRFFQFDIFGFECCSKVFLHLFKIIGIPTFNPFFNIVYFFDFIFSNKGEKVKRKYF